MTCGALLTSSCDTTFFARVPAHVCLLTMGVALVKKVGALILARQVYTVYMQDDLLF
jgi:hypothetical protein